MDTIHGAIGSFQLSLLCNGELASNTCTNIDFDDKLYDRGFQYHDLGCEMDYDSSNEDDWDA
eukprot:9967758-Ditylum_brightwellii.AAC.1